MISTQLTKKAMIISYKAHMNQFDKAGIPYIYHPIHLAEQMDTEIECIVALLHDTVEDTEITFAQLQKEFSNEIVKILRLLTYDKKNNYMEYIVNLKKNLIARKVKIADLIHNSDKMRLGKLTEKDIARMNKYQKALAILQDKEENALL